MILVDDIGKLPPIKRIHNNYLKLIIELEIIIYCKSC